MAIFNNRGNEAEDAQRSVGNAAKTLLANIRFMGVDNPIRTIAITSSVPNEGKTFVARNLAMAIATSGKSVLLVECDLRRRSMANSLGVHGRNGIYSVISGQVPLADAAVKTQVRGFYFLDAEPHIPNPSDVLGSRHFANFVREARETYDYVLFDTPPVGTFVDAAVLGAQVDAVYMVVREHFVRKAEVVEAAEQLRHSNCNLAGVIMNCCETKHNDYYYRYYKDEDKAEGPKLQVAAPEQRPARPERPARRPQPADAPNPPERPARPKKPAPKAQKPDDTSAFLNMARASREAAGRVANAVSARPAVAQAQQGRRVSKQAAQGGVYIPKSYDDEA